MGLGNPQQVLKVAARSPIYFLGGRGGWWSMNISRAAYRGIWRVGGCGPAGSLIALCGFDGSGKTTQGKLLVKALVEKGRAVVETKQPTDWYRNEPSLRAYIDTGNSVDQLYLALLAAADRRKHVLEVIDPALEAGAFVISDRYVYSTLAYFAARGVNPDLVASFNRDIPKPCLTVLLDVPPSILIDRIRERDGARFKYEERSVAAIDAVRQNFLRLAEIDPTILLVNGLEHPNDIHRRISDELDMRCSGRERAEELLEG